MGSEILEYILLIIILSMLLLVYCFYVINDERNINIIRKLYYMKLIGINIAIWLGFKRKLY